jgi:cytochrome c2
MFIRYTLLAAVVIASLSCASGTADNHAAEAANAGSRAEEMSQDNAAGKQLFMQNCTSCHHVTRNLTGPAIYGVRSRWKNKQLLYDFVRNPMAVIKKDKYAKEVYEKWNKLQMNAFPQLKDAEIESIFDYVDAEAK